MKRESIMRFKLKVYFKMLLGMVIVLSSVLVTSYVVHAFDQGVYNSVYNECIGNSFNSSFGVYIGTCGECANAEATPGHIFKNYSWGTQWFSSTSNMYETTIDLSDKEGVVENAIIYWSSGYACKSLSYYTLERYYTWFGANDTDMSSKVDWIWFSNSSAASHGIVGNFNGPGSWVAPTPASLSIDIEGFRNYSGTSCVSGDDGTETCQAMIYVSGCAEETSAGKYVYGVTTGVDGHLMQCGGTPSTVVIKTSPRLRHHLRLRKRWVMRMVSSSQHLRLRCRCRMIF